MVALDNELLREGKRGSKGSAECRSYAADLPESYGRSRVVLMPVDPFRVHAYWEMTLRDRLNAREQLTLRPNANGEPTWVLRFYDVTLVEFDGTNARGCFDVPVLPSARNWYVDLWSAQKSYFVELGLRSGAAFVPVCRSKAVHVPRADPSPQCEPRWRAASTPSENDAQPAPGAVFPARAELHAPKGGTGVPATTVGGDPEASARRAATRPVADGSGAGPAPAIGVELRSSRSVSLLGSGSSDSAGRGPRPQVPGDAGDAKG